MIFAGEIKLFSYRWLFASEAPFEDAVKRADADEEEEHPACIDGGSHRVVIGNLVRADIGCDHVNDPTRQSRASHAEDDPGDHAGEQHIEKTGPSGCCSRGSTDRTTHE